MQKRCKILYLNLFNDTITQINRMNNIPVKILHAPNQQHKKLAYTLYRYVRIIETLGVNKCLILMQASFRAFLKATWSGSEYILPCVNRSDRSRSSVRLISIEPKINTRLGLCATY